MVNTPQSVYRFLRSMRALNLQIRGFAATVVIGVAFTSACAQEKAPGLTERPFGSYVKPVHFALLAERFATLPKRDHDLVTLYLKGARRYVLTVSDGVFPNGGAEHWRNIAERAHGAAVLAALPSDWPKDLKERCR